MRIERVSLFISITTICIILMSFQSKKKYQWFSYQTSKKEPFYLYVGCEPTNNMFCRIYLNDSVFVDKLFAESVNCFVAEDTFKVINDIWYYKFQGKYLPYLSSQAFNNNKVVVKKNLSMDGKVPLHSYHYTPLKKEIIDGKETYLFTFNSYGGELYLKEFADTVYFNPKIGIIKKAYFGCYVKNLVEIDNSLYSSISNCY